MPSRPPHGGPTADGTDGAGDVTKPKRAALPGAPPALAGSMDRFVVLERVGEGGMGVVYKAYDRELDRPVALKFLHASTREDWQNESRGRLLREAKALARLNHPNVLAVFDVGTKGEEIFLATEFVEGPTLATWLGSEPRSRGEVLTTFLAAGEGLAAAHAAGLVHRDFKPGNVIVGSDGRVRVLDFGVARVAATDGPQGKGRDATAATPRMASGSSGEAAEESTGGGEIVGTPRYMSPEQHLGEGVGPKADQFSFALSLYEALYGEPPFEGSGTGLINEVILGRVRRPRPGSDVPRWIRTVLVRALDPLQDRRYPSMVSLLAALRDDPAIRRRRWLSIGVTVGSVLAVGLWAVSAQRARAGLCRGGEQELAGVWDAGKRAEVDAALSRASAPYAAETARSVVRMLDTYARSWTDARQQACEATRVRGEQSEDLLDLRMQCFDQRLAELRERTTVLASADGATTERAVESVRSLPPLSACSDVAGLRSPVRLPAVANARERLEAVQTRVARASALTAATRLNEAGDEVTAAVEEARRLGYAPALSESLRARAAVEEQAGKYETSVESYREAIAAAETGHDETLAARGWSEMISVIGDRLGRFDDARGLLWIARAKNTRLTDPGDAPAKLALVEAKLDWRKGRYQEAEPLARQALATFEQVRGPRSPEAAKALGWLGLVLGAEGKDAEAGECHARDLAIMEETFGPEHPSTLPALTHVADARGARGDHAGAAEIYEKVLRIEERTLGPDHPTVGKIHNNLADELLPLGRTDEVIAHLERALAIWESSVGPNNFDVATGLFNLGTAYLAKGDAAAALPPLRRSLAISNQVYGTSHYVLVGVLLGLGRALRMTNAVEEGREMEARAFAIDAKLAPSERNYELAVRLALGEALLAANLSDRAIETLQAALPKPGEQAEDGPAVERARSDLARALAMAHEPRAGADAPRASAR